MASLRRLMKPGQAWWTINSLKSLTSSSPATRNSLHRQYRWPFEYFIHPKTSEGPRFKSTCEFHGFLSILPAVLVGILGVGLQETHADANQVDSKAPSSSQAPSTYADSEKFIKQERSRLEELLRSKGMHYGSYPPFTVAVKGEKVTVKFQIPPTCEVSHLIVDLVSHLGLKADEHGSGSDMILRAWDSAVAWQLTLRQPKKQEVGRDGGFIDANDECGGDLCILVFQSLISADNAEIEFIKKGSFSAKELDALVSALKLAGVRAGARKPLERRPRGYVDKREKADTAQLPSTEKSMATLEAMGVRIFGLTEPLAGSPNDGISWDNIAGYDEQKREIEDTILLALHSPEVYDDIARGTRCKFETNRPRAVLFEGPPGTGKTSCARVIANQAGVALLYVPLEVVMSKYYGESERLLGTVFSLANGLPNGAIIFLDEVDSFAAARDNEMHEATRRILSVLLRQIDGFEQERRVVVIAATNRKQDLDPALISRFDSMITFGLPDQHNREAIAAQYAKHLKKSELIEFASVTEEMSGRDIRDICQQAERHWASKIIRGQVPSDAQQGRLPPVQEYIESALNRRKALLSIADKKSQTPNPRSKKSPLEFL
ncbi:PREDICTED: katanin p60 ATPase-containing subunit A1 [Nelumbo nucifera]|uniref:Katanin p60 ATPase-containing subunit A1 n=2 Tax=Nelumbo nucifera TaxID=4432 RepID=A0A1U7ZU97_NELNU|nr:PREDICTED: katanin p60 ATPase-containing subunit A1 [Nelumbo nucifera]XP_010252533.1 PREDICTED: katanin p60 ATPase-containing subunit A1 [Nelumbo nucifera]